MIPPKHKPYDEKPDDELWRLFHVKRNPDAFEALYKRHNQRIFFFIYGYTKDYTLASDILQDTIVKILQADKTLAPDFIVHNFVNWAIEFSKNILISRMRKLDRRKEILAENVTPLKKKSVELSSNFDAELLKECIGEVQNVRYRKILQMMIQGLKVGEIGEQLKICQKKVTDSKYLAKKEFEKVLKRKGIFQEYKDLIR